MSKKLTYDEMREKYGFQDSQLMRDRWAYYVKARAEAAERTKRRHKLYTEDRKAWNAEISKLTPKEQARQRRIEESKSALLKKLHR